MKTFVAALLGCCLASSLRSVPAIPEPGAVFFGRVTAAGTVVDISSMSVTVTDPVASRTITYSMAAGDIERIVSNGEVGYVLRIPFVTRSVAGLTFDALPANAFDIASSTRTYTRSTITVNGVMATLQSPTGSSFSMPQAAGGTPTNSLLERIDLTVPIGIAMQPANVAVASGSNATLTVNAAGSGLSYQWYRGNSGVTANLIVGATSASYVVPATTTPTNYWVRITNSAGSVDSAAATVSATETWSQFVPTAAMTAITIMPGAGEFFARVEIAFPTAGFRVGDWGVIPTPNAKPESSSNAGATVVTTISHDYSLGVLAPGDYQFTFSAWGQAVKTISYSIRTLATTVTPPGSGTIALNPAPIDGSKYLSGTVVTLTASPATGSFTQFQNWSGDLTGSSSPATITLSANKSVTATFVAGAAPVITAQPQSISVNSGQTATLSVTAAGASPLTYQWYLGFSGNTANPIASATASTFVTPALTATTTYWVRVMNSLGSINSSAAVVAINSNAASATHAVVGVGYVPGRTVTITNTITYSSQVSSLGWQVMLPTGWTFISGGGSQGEVKPTAGDTSVIAWAWTSTPSSPATFTYTLSVPTNHSGPKVLTSMLVGRLSVDQFAVLAQPSPLSIGQVFFHSADTMGDTSGTPPDGRLSLVELTRVIELYNYRVGTVRTGQYSLQAGTEDGFVAGPGGAPPTFYHSADTVGDTPGTPPDGRINLLELLRIIQLYNYRAGSVRTGQYHVQSGTEDGFAPGPG